MIVKNDQIHADNDIQNERVDDIPLLLAQMREMRVPELINQCFPTHGNWQGLSLGHVTAVWLTFIMSQGNHRLSHLQSWAATRLQTLRASLGVPLVATDFTDDRLALALDYLSDNEGWQAFEDALNGHLLRIYDLHGDIVRLDSTTASSYGKVTPDGLLQFGHSKDHRPDLPQLKINLAMLDQGGLPLTATITSGEKADDPLYPPEIDRVRQTLQKHGLLYVGDSKMGALSTRAHLVAGGDYYLCPLSAVQVSAAALAQLLEPVSRGELKPAALWRRDEETGRREKIGAGFEFTVTLTAEPEGQPITWEERRLVVCSLTFAQAQKKGLAQRLRRAAAEIRQLNQRKQGKKELKTEAEYRAAVEKILTRQRVSGLLQVDYLVKRREQQLRAWGSRPARVAVTETWSVRVRRDLTAIQAAQEQLGWRVYATNAPEAKLSLTKAVLIYRGSPQIERGFRRLKGPLSLTPLYLQTTTRLTGLVRLLLIGLRALGLLEYKARRSLAAKGEQVAGLTKGLPKKATARPTTEAILQAFEDVTLSRLGDTWYLTPLSALQKQLLDLLGFSPDIYHCLVRHFSEVPIQMSET